MKENAMEHSYFLKRALEYAIKAQGEGQNPIGCVIVDEAGVILASAHNEVDKRNDRTAHAEMLAMKKAIRYVDGENTRKWTLYTTIEPCIMCLGMIIMTHIGTVVWGSNDRHIEAHKLLTESPFMRTRKLVTVACPDPDIERECKKIHDAYWISQDRPDAIIPIDENTEGLMPATAHDS